MLVDRLLLASADASAGVDKTGRGEIIANQSLRQIAGAIRFFCRSQMPGLTRYGVNRARAFRQLAAAATSGRNVRPAPRALRGSPAR